MTFDHSSFYDPPYNGKYGVKVKWSNRPGCYFWFFSEGKRNKAYKKYLEHIKDMTSHVVSVEKVERLINGKNT